MIHFYKPNAKVTGSACSFYLSDRDGAFFSQFLKQASWNEKTRTGSFAKDNPAKKASIKLTDIEIAGIIDALESDREYLGYHKSEKQIATFKFSPYVDKVSGVRKGFSYILHREAKDDSTNKMSFVIGLTFPEARRLRQHLEFLLYRYDEAKANAALERRGNGGDFNAPAVMTALPMKVPVGNIRGVESHRGADAVKVKEHQWDSIDGAPTDNNQNDGDIW